ncbi:hypothetical protein PQG02_08140 [Nostoc sp. UHCC 0926]|uniref:hypothetical protein n=1 Tax=Nostoc sp. TaxID=1180 RepID=UPI0027A1CB11|nr:hypothetical protein PQG02_08140 [Nostoc sp. UHCC 0926]
MLRYKTLLGDACGGLRLRLILIIAATTPNPGVSVGVASGREAYRTPTGILLRVAFRRKGIAAIKSQICIF